MLFFNKRGKKNLKTKISKLPTCGKLYSKSSSLFKLFEQKQFIDRAFLLIRKLLVPKSYLKDKEKGDIIFHLNYMRTHVQSTERLKGKRQELCLLVLLDLGALDLLWLLLLLEGTTFFAEVVVASDQRALDKSCSVFF